MSDKTRKQATPGTLDDELERDLAQIRPEWNVLEAAEPPDLVDQAVLNTARRDLEPPAKTRPLRWLGGLATAAVVVLAFSVILDTSPPGVDTRPDPALEDSLRKESAAVTDRAAEQLRSAPPVAAEKAATPRAEFNQEALPDASPRAMTREARRLKAVPGAALAEDEALPGPDEWIEQLLALKKAGLEDRLEEELEAFRSAYPDIALPAELTTEQP